MTAQEWVRIINIQREMYMDSIDSGKDVILEFIRNKEIPLEERWNLFKSLPRDFLKKSYWTGYPSFDSPYDDFGINEYEEVEAHELIYLIDDPDKVELLKEEILQEGYTSLVFDW